MMNLRVLFLFSFILAFGYCGKNKAKKETTNKEFPEDNFDWNSLDQLVQDSDPIRKTYM